MAMELWDITVRAGLVTTTFLLDMVILEKRCWKEQGQTTATAGEGQNGAQAPSFLLPRATT